MAGGGWPAGRGRADTDYNGQGAQDKAIERLEVKRKKYESRQDEKSANSKHGEKPERTIKMTVEKIERELEILNKERARVEAANNAAIEAEEKRDYFDKDRQAQTVAALKAKRDAALGALDRIRGRKTAELQTALAERAAFEARQAEAQRAKAEKMKREAMREYLAAGGLPEDFEAHWQAVLVARTAERLDAQKRRSLVSF